MAETLVQKQAPDFAGEAVVGQAFKKIRLADYQGKWLILFFYPLDFTFVCPTEITAFDDNIEAFGRLGCSVVGCSVDSAYTHLAWINTPRAEGGLGPLRFPLLSDLTKDISRAYGVLSEGGVALRGLFLINPKGRVVYSVVHDLGVGRSIEETLRVAAAFQQVERTGEVCPMNWRPGDETMKADPVKSKAYFQKSARATNGRAKKPAA